MGVSKSLDGGSIPPTLGESSQLVDVEKVKFTSEGKLGGVAQR
jgi:hypothetical protein